MPAIINHDPNDPYFITTVPMYANLGTEHNDTLGDEFFGLLSLNENNAVMADALLSTPKLDPPVNAKGAKKQTAQKVQLNSLLHPNLNTMNSRENNPMRRSLLNPVGSEKTTEKPAAKVKAQPRIVRRSTFIAKENIPTTEAAPLLSSDSANANNGKAEQDAAATLTPTKIQSKPRVVRRSTFQTVNSSHPIVVSPTQPVNLKSSDGGNEKTNKQPIIKTPKKQPSPLHPPIIPSYRRSRMLLSEDKSTTSSRACPAGPSVMTRSRAALVNLTPNTKPSTIIVQPRMRFGKSPPRYDIPVTSRTSIASNASRAKPNNVAHAVCGISVPPSRINSIQRATRKNVKN